MLNISSKKKISRTKYIAGYTKPEYIRSCYTCGGCNTACPVSAATGRLQPMKLVHMANLGCIDELVCIPDIWYYLNCGRCANLCPMMVQSSALFQNLRAEAVARKIVSPELQGQHTDVLKGLISVLWHAARALLDGNTPKVTEHWDEWVQTPPAQYHPADQAAFEHEKKRRIYGNDPKLRREPDSPDLLLYLSRMQQFMPICLDSLTFDPLRMVRSANFALKEELLQAPGIWLCLDCRSCIAACSQGVKVALLIRELQYLAYTQEFVAKDFPLNWMALKKEVYTHYIRKIDTLLTMNKAA